MVRAGSIDKTRAKNEGLSVRGVEISHPEKILIATPSTTKGDICRYYDAVADAMLDDIGERPLMLLRCPQGRRGRCFFQKHFTDGNERVGTVSIEEDDGSEDLYAVVTKAREIVELAQLNCIEFHTWGSRASNIEHADRLVFDLDPGPGVKTKDVVALAHRLRAFLEQWSLKSFPRVTGGKGAHLVVPIAPKSVWDEVKSVAHALAELFGKEEPLVTTNLSLKKRRGRVFVDYLRNGRGSTAIGNYSLRARDGAPVAVPLAWDELSARTKFDGFGMREAMRRAVSGDDPWKGIRRLRQALPHM